MMSKCRSCGQPIQWARMWKSGARIPLDPVPKEDVGSASSSRAGAWGASPSAAGFARTRAGGPLPMGPPAGNLEVIWVADDGVPLVRMVPVEERPRVLRLRLSHFATCPDAEEWRQKGTPPRRSELGGAA